MYGRYFRRLVEVSLSRRRLKLTSLKYLLFESKHLKLVLFFFFFLFFFFERPHQLLDDEC